MSSRRSESPDHRRQNRLLACLALVGAVVVLVAVMFVPSQIATLSTSTDQGPSAGSGSNPFSPGGSFALVSPAFRTSATTASLSTDTTAPSCGGSTVVVSNGITWGCSFDTEFSGTSLDTTEWTPVTTASSGYTSGKTACFENSPNNVSVGNGYLSLTARKEAAPFTCTDPLGSFTTQYTSGTITSFNMFEQTYGRFEVSAKVPTATIAGLQSSLWLYPQTMTYGPWPASGEIDLAEVYSRYADRAIPYIHYYYNGWTTNHTTNTNVVTNNNCFINTGQFNDYVVEWTPTTITMIYNGKTCLIDHWKPRAPEVAPEPFNEPFFINLTQALGVGTNTFNARTTPLPATTEIQYVRVWQMQP